MKEKAKEAQERYEASSKFIRTVMREVEEIDEPENVKKAIK